MLKKVIALMIFAALFSSCIPNERIIYVQNKEDLKEYGLDTLIALNRQDYRLQPNDRITLSFFSEVEEAVAKFNLSGIASSVNQRQNAGQSQNQGNVSRFDINKDGFIEINVLGDIQAAGLTERELKLQLEQLIRDKEGVNDILVRAQLDGIPFTTIGSVAPGRHIIDKNEANILEALALAGDLGLNADRKNVEIIRQYPDGVRIHRVDVTDRAIISNRLYYIQPNDIIHVLPLKIRELGAGSAGLQNFALIVSTLSSAFVIINLLGNN